MKGTHFYDLLWCLLLTLILHICYTLLLFITHISSLLCADVLLTHSLQVDASGPLIAYAVFSYGTKADDR